MYSWLDIKEKYRNEREDRHNRAHKPDYGWRGLELHEFNRSGTDEQKRTYQGQSENHPGAKPSRDFPAH
jgi:hypothetical protein